MHVSNNVFFKKICSKIFLIRIQIKTFLPVKLAKFFFKECRILVILSNGKKKKKDEQVSLESNNNVLKIQFLTLDTVCHANSSMMQSPPIATDFFPWPPPFQAIVQSNWNLQSSKCAIFFHMSTRSDD